ncbi:MAG: helix-turn-helix transcriptional regulator [Oscillospiraceae bacterium]|nr:helix-turn-helix transcriptional regulator [Oscillospiraceae bacterium]
MTDEKKNLFITDRKKEVLPDGGIRTSMMTEKGDIRQTKYCVFPGINLFYNDIHISNSYGKAKQGLDNIFEINHCREGRLECHVGDEYFYISPGDISMHLIHSVDRRESFPTSHYHGVTVQIDLNKCPASLTEFLPDINVKPAQIAEKFGLQNKNFYILRRMPEIEHIFSELYKAPETVKKGYFSLKILELMLFLDGINPTVEQNEAVSISGVQASTAHEISRYINANLDKKLTLKELSEKFDISVSYIKNIFNAVYGMSVTKYIRSQRISQAAALLEKTDRTVLDISGQLGYENSSKFAAAFRRVMGVSPAQYRKRGFNSRKEDV